MVNAICDSVMSAHKRGVVLCDGLGWLRCFVLKLSKQVLEAGGLSDASATRFTFINQSELSCSSVKGDIVRVKINNSFTLTSGLREQSCTLHIKVIDHPVVGKKNHLSTTS